MASIKAKANPKLLTWARTSSGFSISDAAKKIGVKDAQLEAWEVGNDQPTVPQLRKVASVYKRALSIFFLSDVPRDFTIPHDFRRLPGEIANIYSPELRVELRLAHERRDVALQLYEEIGEGPSDFALTAKMGDDPENLSARVREALSVNYEVQSHWRNPYIALREWRQRLENLGALVFQFSGIGSSEVRGFSLAENLLPVIAVNRAETPNARIFSLMHELVHLMLRQSSICDFEEDGKRSSADEQTEVFCNRVAAAILVPRVLLEQEAMLRAVGSSIRDWSESEIKTLASTYSVSREVIVRRLVTVGRSNEAFYKQKRNEYLAEYAKLKAIPKDGFAENYGRKRASILGNFARVVLQSYHRDVITLADVSGYLGIKLKHLSKLERALETA